MVSGPGGPCGDDRGQDDHVHDDEADATTDLIRVEVPATAEHLRLARLVVAGAASQHDASLDDIEDLRLAVGEVCAHLVALAPAGARLRLEVRAGPDRVAVRAEAPCRDGADAPDDLTVTLLATVTDEHGRDAVVRGTCAMWFRRAIGAHRRT